jgi:hypothetical protein
LVLYYCSILPIFRVNISFVEKMASLLHENGKIIGLLFNKYLDKDTPPFGGNKEEYRKLFENKFEIKKLEECYNSIKPRKNTEVFINFQKKKY